MTLQLTDEERDLLLDLLKAAHSEMQHELHHTDKRDYRGFLRQRIEILERVTAKVETTPQT